MKSAHDELNELVNSQLIKNSIVTEDVKENIIFRITDYYVDKRLFGCKSKYSRI